jgi:hypothetical protein
MLRLKVNYFFTEKEREKFKWCAINKSRLVMCDWKKARRFKLTNVNGVDSRKDAKARR